MRRSIILGAVAVVAACLPTLAHAEWYAGLEAGGSYLQNGVATGSSQTYNVEYGFGYGAAAQGGYAFAPGNWGQWKVEGEIGWRTNEVNKATGEKLTAAQGSGTVNALDFMVNGLYEFLPKYKWHPYVGVGAGYALVNTGRVTNSGNTVFSNGGDWQPAYQGIAGVAYDINSNWAVKADYRYFATADVKVRDPSDRYPMTVEYHDHAVMLGFTYKFGKPATQTAAAPPPKPVAPVVPAAAKTVAAAPAVAQASAQRTFTVNFGFNSASLDGTAKGILTQAVATAKAGGPTRISVTGHTDRVGSDAYNMALSQRRAEAVRDYMVTMGLPAGQIAVYAMGEREPLVPTRDGVREARNRRVEIVLPGPSS
ncbi:MAG: OmpW family outer membrane protein [Actinomycetota bacterium]